MLEKLDDARGRQAVTGAFGFTGRYIAARLLKAGNEVITLTSSPDRPNPFGGKIAPYPYDFERPEKMAEYLNGVDTLYNTYWVRFNHGGVTHEDAVCHTSALFKAAELAGVRRVVHISIANADRGSDLSYYRAKARLEEILAATALSYAIVRPAALFGEQGVLFNNIAWTLRHFPVFGVFGKGDYHIQPIYVDDLAAIMLELAQGRRNVTVNALGPEDFTYRELVRTLGRAIGCPRPMLRVPVWAGFMGTWLIGKLKGDIFLTGEELKALMGDLLHVPGAAATGGVKFSDWARANADKLGKSYSSELVRRTNKRGAY